LRRVECTDPRGVENRTSDRVISPSRRTLALSMAKVYELGAGEVEQ
jgi:hypothetical protein